ncbi:hypothetical protein AVEN_51983-1 [Araneus ventricosus]|uniref:Uncharacterized protein n=1 Tax=Araneus ventricosus TaxID=182803 RepID=A0A4Y2CEK9_ARAVE|nr:hypothetical protein AVEN_51983-1 [Araneus ventricosus]
MVSPDKHIANLRFKQDKVVNGRPSTAETTLKRRNAVSLCQFIEKTCIHHTFKRFAYATGQSDQSIIQGIGRDFPRLENGNHNSFVPLSRKTLFPPNSIKQM